MKGSVNYLFQTLLLKVPKALFNILADKNQDLSSARLISSSELTLNPAPVMRMQCCKASC
jgi:hypothetical protein